MKSENLILTIIAMLVVILFVFGLIGIMIDSKASIIRECLSAGFEPSICKKEF